MVKDFGGRIGRAHARGCAGGGAVAAWWVGAAAVGLAAASASGALPEYVPSGTFMLPAGAAAYDVMPDGRVMAIVGDVMYVQSSLNGSAFAPAGSVPSGLISSFGASFLRVSPDGSRIAIGDNRFGAGAEVLIVEAGTLSPVVPSPVSRIACDNYDAHWAGSATLYVSGAGLSGAGVFRVDVATLQASPVVAGIGGASGGVTTDGVHLYTANGFSIAGPSPTGAIKAFALSSLTPGAPVDFESDGRLVAQVLSGNTLGFDGLGNLLAGGGDWSAPDPGFAAVVDGEEVLGALAGGPMATSMLRLSPTTEVSHFIRHNPGTGELLITTFGDPTVHRYVLIPAPWSAAVLGLWGVSGRRRRG